MKYFLAGAASILVLLLAVVGGFYVGMKRITPTPIPWMPTVIPSPILPTPALTSRPISDSTPVPLPTPNDVAAIKSALAEKLGVTEDSLEVTISENIGTHAKGNVKELEAVGGAYWIAAKVGDYWVIVYDGQANPTCAEITPYDFPSSMVPECYAADGSVITR